MRIQSVANRILRRMRASRSATVFSAKDFLDLGSRASVDQALTRISRAGKVRRLGRGLYDIPAYGTLIRVLAPSLDSAAAAVARKSAARIGPTGAQTANMFGLSLQVPAQARYLTDRTSRTVTVGKQKLRLDRVAPRRLAGNTVSNSVIEALRHIGQDRITPQHLLQISKSLSAGDRKLLQTDAKLAPDWMWPLLMQIVTLQNAD